MLALAFTVMLASSGLNDPGIGSPGLDSRLPTHTQSTTDLAAIPQEAYLFAGVPDEPDPVSRAYGRVQ